MLYFYILTHPELSRFTSGLLCPSLSKERGEDTARWLGVSELKYNNKYFSLLKLRGVIHDFQKNNYSVTVKSINGEMPVS
jgi:hypothetical protein